MGLFETFVIKMVVFGDMGYDRVWRWACPNGGRSYQKKSWKFRLLCTHSSVVPLSLQQIDIHHQSPWAANYHSFQCVSTIHQYYTHTYHLDWWNITIVITIPSDHQSVSTAFKFHLDQGPPFQLHSSHSQQSEWNPHSTPRWLQRLTTRFFWMGGAPQDHPELAMVYGKSQWFWR